MTTAPPTPLPHDLIVSVQDVVRRVREAHRDGRKCCLLIGAGCSVSAGIPAGAESVDLIKQTHPEDYAEACGADGRASYADCMMQLSEDERQRFITRYVDQAKINWAHIAIASLIKDGYVDRVLTTNFDPLLIRACGLLDITPSIYDLAVAGDQYHPGYISDPAILYLHGQYHGFSRVMDRIQTSRDDYRVLVRDVIRDINSKNGPWIVAGYSGEEDPVFDELCDTGKYPRRLFWVGYKAGGPTEDAKERLFTPGKDAFFVRESDPRMQDHFTADTFFIQLAQELTDFPPMLMSKPFSYLDGVMSRVPPFPMPGETSPTALPREWLEAAIERYEDTPSEEREFSDSLVLLMGGRFDDVIARLGGGGLTPTSRGAGLLSTAYMARARALYATRDFTGSAEAAEHASELAPDDADAFMVWGAALGNLDQHEEAIEKYVMADELRPDDPNTLHNWGSALGGMGRHEEAIEKFVKAGQLRPDDPDTLVNWGVTLGGMDRREEAIEKYVKADELRPDDPVTLVNWGVALGGMGRHEEAIEKFVKADELRPDDPVTLVNWGVALGRLCRHDEAIEKFVKADELRPDDPDTLTNWGNALDNSERHAEAIEKYALADAVRPDHPDTLNNWSIALMKSGLYDGALEVLDRLDAVDPARAAYNLACVHALKGQDEECRAALTRAEDLDALPSREHMEADSDLDAVRDTDWFRDILERAPSGEADDGEEQGE